MYTWPLEPICGVDLSDLREFLVSRTNTLRTAEAHLSGIEYFFGIFDFGDSCVSLLQLFKKVYSAGLLSRVMRLPLLDKSIPWTHKICLGMERCIDLSVPKCAFDASGAC